MKCPYKYIFGKPKEGVHKYRISDAASVDYFLTIIGAIIISKYFNYPLVFTTIILFVIGELLHYMFCVETSTLKFMSLN